MRAPPDPEPLLQWAESEPELSHQTLVVGLSWVLPPLTIAAMVGSWLFGLPAAAWAAPLLVQMLLNFRAREPVMKVFMAVSSTEGAFLRYGAMLELIEQISVPPELIESLQQQLMSGERRPSLSMKEFRSKVGWFDVRHNGLIHPFINAIFLWDIHCVLALETWQKRAGGAVRGWFRALGELEALVVARRPRARRARLRVCRESSRTAPCSRRPGSAIR